MGCVGEGSGVDCVGLWVDALVVAWAAVGRGVGFPWRTPLVAFIAGEPVPPWVMQRRRPWEPKGFVRKAEWKGHAAGPYAGEGPGTRRRAHAYTHRVYISTYVDLADIHTYTDTHATSHTHTRARARARTLHMYVFI